jgi:DNA-binding transcriptional MerR regulator
MASEPGDSNADDTGAAHNEPGDRLRVDEVAARSGVSVDTVRYYQAQGLMEPPEKDGRIAWYGPTHLERIAEIRRRSDEGFSLAQIKALLAADDPLLAALARDGAADATLDRRALARAAGVSESIVAMAVEVGLLRPVDVDGQERFGSSAPAMLSAGKALVNAGVDPTAFTELALRHAEHTERLVADAVELIHDVVNNQQLSRQEAGDMVSAAIPQVAELVADHFRQTLIRTAADRLIEGDDRR